MKLHASDQHWMRAAARRQFLTRGLGGAGAFALSHLLSREGLADRQPAAVSRATAKACIYIYLEGGPSQMDLFDPKPMLNRCDGDPLPESFTEGVQFAFLQKETARVMGSPRTFAPAGQCGMELSDLLPHLATCADEIALVRSMHTDQFNHVPAQLLMNTGSELAGRPSVGSWLSYGLGSETENLPAFVTLVTAGRGVPGGSASWSSGFLPSSHSGVLFGNGDDAILNLGNPAGVTASIQKHSIDAINDFNRMRFDQMRDPELDSRIRAYELAFRMQSEAPELIDLSDETAATLEAYGVNRTEPPIKNNRGGVGKYQEFSRNCLMARRLVERGVRVVNLVHSSWDHHSGLDRELTHNAGMVDQPIAALLKDLKRRGLLDQTLVVWGSEFGRTSLGENRKGKTSVTGRDHHPGAFSLWMAGGGVPGGQVIGGTDEFGWKVTDRPVHVHDLHATQLRLFGLDHTRLTYRYLGRDFRLTDVHGDLVEPLLPSAEKAS